MVEFKHIYSNQFIKRYGNVESSSGFKPFHEKQITIEKGLIALYKQCLVEYNSMYEKRVII